MFHPHRRQGAGHYTMHPKSPPSTLDFDDEKFPSRRSRTKHPDTNIAAKNPDNLINYSLPKKRTTTTTHKGRRMRRKNGKSEGMACYARSTIVV